MTIFNSLPNKTEELSSLLRVNVNVLSCIQAPARDTSALFSNVIEATLRLITIPKQNHVSFYSFLNVMKDLGSQEICQEIDEYINRLHKKVAEEWNKKEIAERIESGFFSSPAEITYVTISLIEHLLPEVLPILSEVMSENTFQTLIHQCFPNTQPPPPVYPTSHMYHPQYTPHGGEYHRNHNPFR